MLEYNPHLANEYSSTAKTIGLGLVPLGLMVGVLQEQYKVVRGQTPDWLKPITRTIIFTILVGGYSILAQQIGTVVRSFGSIEATASTMETKYSERMKQFRIKMNNADNVRQNERMSQREKENKNENAGYGERAMNAISGFSSEVFFNPATLFTTLFNAFVYVTYIIVNVAIMAIKNVQSILLQIAIFWGPIAIGFAAVHGFFNSLALAWFWAYVEVMAWGIMLKLVFNGMGKIDAVFLEKIKNAHVGTDVYLSYADQAVMNLIYISLILAVPAITSMFIRSQSAAGVGAKGIGSGMAPAMAAVGMASKGASRAFHPASGKSGPSPTPAKPAPAPTSAKPAPTSAPAPKRKGD